MKVLSLGAVAMDVVMECSALPEEDGFALVWKEYTVPGGSASNVSVALQRMGAEAYQTGKIGDDKFGIEFRVVYTKLQQKIWHRKKSEIGSNEKSLERKESE